MDSRRVTPEVLAFLAAQIERLLEQHFDKETAFVCITRFKGDSDLTGYILTAGFDSSPRIKDLLEETLRKFDTDMTEMVVEIDLNRKV